LFFVFICTGVGRACGGVQYHYRSHTFNTWANSLAAKRRGSGC
jgi:hypothetical protein